MGELDNHYKNLLPYIPRTICDWYSRSTADEVHKLSEHHGIIVCIDASGFTALTRQLSRSGDEGPEILTRVLNLFFDAVAGVVFKFGGDVLKFAGDALWAFFRDDLDIGGFFHCALTALESVNSAPELKDRTRLKIHIGAESGSFFLASLGDPGVRLEAEPIGNILGKVYQACDIAGENEFVIGPALGALRSESEKLTPVGEGYSLVAARYVSRPPENDAGAANDYLSLEGCQRLTPYVARDVLAKIETSVPSMSVQGEHRQVVVLFAAFENNIGRRSDDPDQAVVELNRKLAACFETIRRLHGSIARIDPFKRGHKLLVLFGAPTKRENDEINGLLCARELVAMADASFRIRVGLAIGPLFCGDVGAELRREYTVMGDGINLAARLMAKAAWNEILMGPSLRSRLPDEVITEPVQLALKGFGDKVSCHRFVGVSEKGESRTEKTVIVGQHQELERLRSAYDRVNHGEKHLMAVTGETGVGKTFLLTNFVNTSPEIVYAALACKNSLLFERGWLTRRLLQRLLEKNVAEKNSTLDQFIRSNVDDKWLPLLSGIVQSDAVENNWTKGLTPELRTAKIRELLVMLVKKLIQNPALVMVDDFDKADEFFRSLVESLAEPETDLPLMLVVVSREIETCSLSEAALATFEQLNLACPLESQWWQFFEDHFQNGSRERELFGRVLRASQGNPHFIMEFLTQCDTSGHLFKNEVSGKWELAKSGLQISVPDGLAGLHLSLFDGLPEIDRTILKAASVIVGDFTAGLINKALVELDAGSIQARLDILATTGILSARSRPGKYNFVHTSMREAVYNCIPKSQLRALHQKYAEIVKQTKENSHFNLLAYHFYRASAWKDGFYYSLRAAIKAFRDYALTESAEYFHQCSTILSRGNGAEVETHQVFEFYEHYSRFLILEGHYSDAYKLLSSWRKFGKANKSVHDYLMAGIEIGGLLWTQSRYHRSRNVLNSILPLAVKAGDKKAEAMVHAIRCQLERRTGDFAAAQQAGRDAVKLAAEIGDKDTLAEAYNRLGLAYWGTGNLDEAAEVYRQSVELESNDLRRLALTQNNLAIIEQERGFFIKSEELAKIALDTFDKMGDRRNVAYASGNLANLSRIFGKLSRAENLFLQADLIFQRLDDRHAHYYTVGNLGDIEMMRGDLSSAREKFEEVARFAAEVDDKELMSECDVRFGELAFFGGDSDQAESLYRQAIATAEEIGSIEYQTRGCIGLARLLIGKRDHREALEVITNIQRLAGTASAPLSDNEAVFLTGEHHRISNEFGLAAGCYNKSLAFAKEQNIFELILKSAIRLWETSPPSQASAASVLLELRDYFTEHNGSDSWPQLLESSYFSFFSGSLRRVAGQEQPESLPTL
ncbi:MAG: tetratricopeptide repeat protein [Candidatus Zixiibacteriota bacterium]